VLLHLGGDVSVLKKDIVAILDRPSTQNPVTKEFLETASFENRIVEIPKEQDYKSIILVKDKIYFSPISSATLLKRASNRFYFLYADNAEK
jgi:hypothetical protein